MIKDSNGLVHCYPGAVLGICTLSPAFKRFTLDSKAEREEQFFKKHKWAFVRDLPSPSPKFQNNKTYLLLDLEESSTYTNWSHQSPKGYTVRNKKKSRLPQSITWSILFYWWSSFSKPKLREKKIVFILSTLLINLPLNGREVWAQKCCTHINGPKFKSTLHVPKVFWPKGMFALLNTAMDFGWL